MLDYADVYELHVSELPTTLDEAKRIVKKLDNEDIEVCPVQIVREGDWAGVWRISRIWYQNNLIGYVRLDLDAEIVCMRPRWDAPEFIATYAFGVDKLHLSIPVALRCACQTLVLYYLTGMSE